MDDSSSLFGTPREWAKDLAIATVIGVFMGMIGPFGSFYGAAIELRIAYWVANIWIGFIVISTVVRLAIRVAIRFDVPIWFALAIGVALGCFPLGIMVALFSAWFWPGNHGRISPFFIWYGQTLVISEPFSFLYFFVGRRSGFYGDQPVPTLSQTIPPANRPAVGSNGGATFLDRMPPRIGRDLLCLQMEDHYVRAHTERGSDLVLIPLKDAIAELSDTPGLQVHRSWWVAKSAVAAPVSNGRNLSLRLINGLEAPVSRAMVAKLKAAGWIDPA